MSNDFYRSAILPYAGIIIKICRAYANSQEDFEDYYQEVCLQIWRSKDRFKAKSAWSTWIYRVALNVCLTLHKKKKVPLSPSGIDASVVALADHAAAGTNLEIERLYDAIKKLSEIDRAVILLYLEERSYQEIAAIMGTTPSNIGVRINRTKKRLKNILDEKIN